MYTDRRKKVLLRPALARKRERQAIIKISRDCIERLIRDLETAEQNRVLRELHSDIAATLEAMENSDR